MRLYSLLTTDTADAASLNDDESTTDGTADGNADGNGTGAGDGISDGDGAELSKTIEALEVFVQPRHNYMGP